MYKCFIPGMDIQCTKLNLEQGNGVISKDNQVKDSLIAKIRNIFLKIVINHI